MTNTQILIVDDQKDVSQAIQFGLHNLNDTFKISIANDGFEALDILRANSFDLIITDYMMPGMDGLELLESIRALSPKVQVIVTSAAQYETLQDVLDQACVDYFLPKPFHKNELYDLVQEALVNRIPATDAPQAEKSLKPIVAPVVNDYLTDLCRHTGAYCCFIVESVGYLMSVSGGDQQLQLSTLASLIAANTVAMMEISQILGNRDPFQAMIYEGAPYNVATYIVGHGRILTVVFSKQVKIGLVQHYARRIIPSLSEALPPPTTTLDETIFLNGDFKAIINDSLDELFSVN